MKKFRTGSTTYYCRSVIQDQAEPNAVYLVPRPTPDDDGDVRAYRSKADAEYGTRGLWMRLSDLTEVEPPVLSAGDKVRFVTPPTLSGKQSSVYFSDDVTEAVVLSVNTDCASVVAVDGTNQGADSYGAGTDQLVDLDCLELIPAEPEPAPERETVDVEALRLVFAMAGNPADGETMIAMARLAESFRAS
ncbi:hypothetical protein RHODO2019_10770 [Rhodococcus antarcticus]|uniref:Uncharacterized protein n=1 Tax=Rhodococcus antarcticus TaxID=2987751 RepID=A0ABY6NWE7_9NOCA|nr:hypothetical protein [Rhodococcus antarcticus]UZJ23690.1 hypothetical protein RHODO2019_10770 [Rhodococcus antarcticus]